MSTSSGPRPAACNPAAADDGVSLRGGSLWRWCVRGGHFAEEPGAGGMQMRQTQGGEPRRPEETGGRALRGDGCLLRRRQRGRRGARPVGAASQGGQPGGGCQGCVQDGSEGGEMGVGLEGFLVGAHHQPVLRSVSSPRPPVLLGARISRPMWVCAPPCVSKTLHNFASRGGNVREGLDYQLKIFSPAKLTF
jgi:hypothetical protein